LKTLNICTCLLFANLCWLNSAGAAEDDSHHEALNHVAALVGHAEEETADGHHEDGKVWGFYYLRTISEKWSLGVSFEQEGFGDNSQQRHGIVAIPVSYHINDKWRVFAAPGLEFRERGTPDEPMIRIGTGYAFSLGGHFSLTPEAQVDFIRGGTKVYVFALALGYGF